MTRYSRTFSAKGVFPLRLKLLAVCLALVLTTLAAGCVRGEEMNMVDSSDCIKKFDRLEEILEELRLQGRVRVMVALDIEFTPETRLSESEIMVQRERIAQAQEKLTMDLEIPRESIASRMRTLPFMAIILTEKELLRLACHPLVDSVGHDRQVRTMP